VKANTIEKDALRRARRLATNSTVSSKTLVDEYKVKYFSPDAKSKVEYTAKNFLGETLPQKREWSAFGYIIA
jgi:hypothetical protein